METEKATDNSNNGSEGIKVSHIQAKQGIQFYKVLGVESKDDDDDDDQETSIRAYNLACQPSKLDTKLDGDGSTQLSDWRALYTQFLADHVLGTVPYRWEVRSRMNSSNGDDGELVEECYKEFR